MIGLPTLSKKYAAQRPARDEFELEELGNRLFEVHEEGAEIYLTVWGMDEQVRGRITNMDPRTRLVHIERDGDTLKVPYLDIMNVESPRH
ncbi:YolD-like family protein [Paenibacillus oleatilyticus]|uniref:YolD-like family protein n=1 Tax=Paenibacillus oleatilyticus TaxID=2594886 RepID=A0ABV4VC58_9BACL|nr:YolD-like family protein [Paenibacillus oleatilyticus]MBU7319545.1 YolD-like family protein [Paenibacillus oleatilyticus]